MAEWLAWQKGLTRKPEVIAIACRMQMDRRAVAGACMEIWEYADTATADGYVAHVTLELLDDIVGIRGFAAAMAEVGWLERDNGGLLFPNFTRWNTNSAKRRLQDARRQQAKRAAGA